MRFAPPPARSSAEPAAAADAALALGDLPVWKLSDLYASGSDPAFKADMEKAESASKAFEARWKGKLSDAAARDGNDGLGAAIKADLADGAGVRSSGQGREPAQCVR